MMPTKIYTLSEIVGHAAENSAYYRDLYSGVEFPKNFGPEELGRLPPVDQNNFWQANRLDKNQVLTASKYDGIVFKSGGTTGSPKYSYFTRQEWDTFTTLFGEGMVAGGLARGERVANLFYGGGMYASFLFIHGALRQASNGAIELPISGGGEPEEILNLLEELSVTTLAAVPTLLMSIAGKYHDSPQRWPKLKIKKLLFGGESVFDDQREFLSSSFPGVTIQSIGYASVDAGLLGYAHQGDAAGIHRVFSPATVIEIVDDTTGALITKSGVVGRLLVTNMTRKLMPIIRYPAGDLAMWIDEPGRNARFKICGRADEAARVGPVSLYYNDIEVIAKNLVHSCAGMIYAGMQMVVSHETARDCLLVRIGSLDEQNRVTSSTALTQQFLAALFRERKMLKEWVTAGKIGQIQVDWVRPEQLEKNPRTGKTRRIIDLRF